MRLTDTYTVVRLTRKSLNNWLKFMSNCQIGRFRGDVSIETDGAGNLVVTVIPLEGTTQNEQRS